MSEQEADFIHRTVVGRIKGVPEVKSDKNGKTYAWLSIVVPGGLDRDTGEQFEDEWFNIAAYGEKMPAKLATTFAAGDNVIAVISQRRDDDGGTFNRLLAIGANTYLEDVEISRRPKAASRRENPELAPAPIATPTF